MKRLVLAAIAALAFPAAAWADPLTLHPVGHGEDSHANWVANEGQPDQLGNAHQALFMQNAGVAGTVAAAHIMGVEGLRADFLVALQYEHRNDSVCNVFTPRWAIFVRGGRTGRMYTVNLGCATSPPSPAGPGWTRRTWTQAVIRTALLRAGRDDALFGTITALALVYDRTPGYAYIDDIFARSRFGRGLWTFAGDNGDQDRLVRTFSAEELLLLAAEPTPYELMTNDELLATNSEEDWALVLADADTFPEEEI